MPALCSLRQTPRMLVKSSHERWTGLSLVWLLSVIRRRRCWYVMNGCDSDKTSNRLGVFFIVSDSVNIVVIIQTKLATDWVVLHHRRQRQHRHNHTDKPSNRLGAFFIISDSVNIVVIIQINRATDWVSSSSSATAPTSS